MRKRWIALFLCVVLCAAALAGCAAQPAEETGTPETSESPEASVSAEAAEPSGTAEADGVTVTDMAGNEVTVKKADKIVSLTPAGTELSLIHI